MTRALAIGLVAAAGCKSLPPGGAVTPADGSADAAVACAESLGAVTWTRIDRVTTSAPVGGVWVSSSWTARMMISGAPSEVWTVAADGTIQGLGPSARFFALHQAGRPLRAVWGSRRGDVWAVGDGGAVLRWRSPDPSTIWAPVDSGVTVRLNTIWGTDAEHVWTAGERGTILALQADGQRWMPLAAAGVPGDLELTSLWAARPDELWLTAAGQAFAFRLKGGAWTREPTGAPGALRALGGTGADDLWAVGEKGTVVHWDGARWAAHSTGVTSSLNGVWAGAKDHAWVVGDGGVSLWWNGRRWSAVNTGTTSDLLAVSGGATERIGLGASRTPSGGMVALWAAGADGSTLAFTQSREWTCAVR